MSTTTEPNAVPHSLFASTASALTVASLIAACVAGCSRHDAAPAHPSAQAKPASAVAAPVAAAAAASATAPVRTDPAIDAPAINETQAATLMQAIFGDAYRSGDHAALLDIADGDNAGDWRMTPIAARTLADGRIAVLVNGAPSDESGADTAGHASPGMLNVYVLRQADGAYQMLERHEDVVTTGTFGNVGSIQWITLGDDKPGFVLASGGTWFGSTIAFAEVYELGHGVRSLGSFSAMSSNAGACRPDLPDCWEVDGKIGSVPAAHAQDYRDLVVDFSGRHFRVSEDAQGKQTEHATRAVRQRARYRFDGKQYALVEGENPVPAIDN